MPKKTVKTPNLKGLRELLGIKQEPEKYLVTDAPKLPNGEVNLDALAEKVRKRKKD